MNLHVAVEPIPGAAYGGPAANFAIIPASKEVTAPFPLTSATAIWLAVNCGFGGPATCSAILPASNELIEPFTPPVLDGVTVYAPEPKPVSVYCPAVAPGGSVVVKIPCEPSPVRVTFETNRGDGAPIALK